MAALVVAAGGLGFGVAELRRSGTSPSSASSGTSARMLAAVPSTPIKPRAGQTRAEAIYAAASPAVVSIRTGTGSGTGFLIDRKGTLVTNAHVVGQSRSVTVRFGNDGQAIAGGVIGSDPSTDVAVVRIPTSQIASGTSPLQLADSDKVAVGEPVYAIGNPFGLDRTLTEGIVSAVDRDIEAPNGFQIPKAIQTDAAINPGNSGGPLLDDGGKVIGINSQIETGGTSSGNVGVGFAVPSNAVRRVVPSLEAGRTVEHPWLGVSTSDAGGAGGARVEQVVGGSPAAAAGLRAGDVIVGVEGRDVADAAALGSLVAGYDPGDAVRVRVRRGDTTTSVEVTLRRRPAQAP